MSEEEKFIPKGAEGFTAPDNASIDNDRHDTQPDTQDKYNASEEFRSSLADRLREIGREADPARREVLERLKQSPLWSLMEEAHRESEQREDIFSDTDAHNELVGSGFIPEGGASKAVGTLLEGEQLWDDLKLTHTSEVVKSVSTEVVSETDVIKEKITTEFEENDLKIRSEIEAARSGLEKLDNSEGAELIATLERIGFSPHNNAEANLQILKNNEADLPNEIQIKLRAAEEEEGMLTRMFGGRASGLWRSSLLREIDDIVSIHSAATEGLNNKLQELTKSASENESKKKENDNDDSIFSKLYGDKLRESVVEKTTGTPLERTGKFATHSEVLRRQNRFAKALQEASDAVSDPEKFLDYLASTALDTGSNIEEKVRSLNTDLMRLPAIENEIKAIDFKTVSDSEEATQKLEQKRMLEREREEIIARVEENQNALPHLYDIHSGNLSIEATVKSIVGDKEKLQKVLDAYQKISRDVFGVPVEKLGIIVSAHNELITELEDKSVAAMNETIVANTQGVEKGELGGAYDFENLKDFLGGGGKALVFSLSMSSGGHCTRGEVSSQYLSKDAPDIVWGSWTNYERDSIAGVGSALQKQFPFPWQLFARQIEPSYGGGRKMGKQTISMRNYNNLDAVWVPVSDGVNLDELGSACNTYRRKTFKEKSREYNGCDVYSGAASVSPRIVKGE